MPNKLAAEKSPYLLQHADNPVDWLPWGEEALERARREDKPILVSIGYSACHWCHVMAHESFEDRETARFMNEHFVNIKVDREERPDVDAVYMEAVQAMTGHGGWPLNVFLAPDGRPFFGGTYFPPQTRAGMPSWRQVLERIVTLYADEKDVVTNNAEAMTRYLLQAQQTAGATDEPSPETLKSAFASTLSQIDWVEGGFGGAPKFPQPLALGFLLRMSLRWGDESPRSAVELSLRKMAEGGIFDQLGGGFHRYSVDGYWRVPHFEKMLYDNALLARVYVQAFQLTHDSFYRDIAVRTLDYVLHDLRSPEGGFFSAEDADSEGVEGKFYVWISEELEEILGPEATRIVERCYGATKEGNFERENILHVAASVSEVASALGSTEDEIERSLAESRQKLLEARSKRVPPGKDTKILVSWNALAIRALAEAGRVFGRTDYLEAATRAANFLLTSLRPGGRLVRSLKDGPSNIPAFLEDYAYLAEALLTLYETAFDAAFLKEAEALIQEMVECFWDGSQKVFFDTAAESQTGLPVRARSMFDNPIPSGNSAATFAILRWMALTGDEQFAQIPLAVFRSVKETLTRAPLAFSYLLSALDFHLSAPMQIAIVGEPGEDEPATLVDVVFDQYLPNKVVSVGQPDESPLLAGKASVDGKPTAYVCENFACQMPVTDARALAEQLSVPTQPASRP